MNRHCVLRLATFLVIAGAVWLAGPTGARAGGSRAFTAGRVKPPAPGIYQFDDLTTVDAARINRAKTVVLQPVGMLQPHGPHLPAGTDNLIVQALVERTAAELRARNPAYNVLIMPILPIGTGAFNEIGYVYNHPASVTVSRRVVEAALIDWGINFASNSWPNFFFISFHHDPSQFAILTEVSRFLHDGYGVNTANITSLVLADSSFQAQSARLKGAPDSLSIVFELDGGAAETSLLLAAAPDRVDPDYRALPAVPVRSWDEATATAQRLGWPLYFGHPAAATAAYGRNLFDLLAQEHAGLILSAIADHTFGEKAPHFEDVLKREFSLREVVRNSEEFETRQHVKFQKWVVSRKAAEDAPKTDDAPPKPSGTPDGQH